MHQEASKEGREGGGGQEQQGWGGKWGWVTDLNSRPESRLSVHSIENVNTDWVLDAAQNYSQFC